MTTRSKSPAAGFDWLKNGFSVARRHPKPLLGGAALLVVVCLLPSLITMPLQYRAMSAGAAPSPATFIGTMVFSALFGLLLVPLYAGYLQLVDAAERGLPAGATDIFKPYRSGEALRLIGYGLAMMVVYVVLFGLIFATTGGSVFSWYMQAIAAQTNHLPPPGLPQGFGIVIALSMLIGLLMMGFYSISLGQVALRKRPVLGAIGDGLIGAEERAATAGVCTDRGYCLACGGHRPRDRGARAGPDRQARRRMAGAGAGHSAVYRRRADGLYGHVRSDVPLVARCLWR